MSSNSSNARVVAALFTLLMTLGACAQQNNVAIPELLKPVAAPADVVTVQRGDVRQLSIYEGAVVAHSVPLHFYAYDAPIGAVYVSPGDEVKAGDVLAELDTTQLDLAVTMLEDSLEFSEALWRNTNAQGSAGIARAESAGMTELADKLRTQLGYERQSQTLERQRVRGKLERLEARRDGYRIVAPFDGHIAHIERVAPGGFVMPRTAFIWISDLTDITVQSSDSQLRFEVMRDGVVTADFGYGEVGTRTLTYTAAENMVFRQQNITPPVRFAPLEGESFPVDRRILLRVYGQTRTDVLTLIPNAVHDDTVMTDGTPHHSYFVYLDDNGTRVRRDVKLGLTSDTSVEIIDGLQEGDKVYVEEN